MTVMSAGLEVRPIGDLRESPDNPRQIAPERLDQLKHALSQADEMMGARPIIATPDGEVVCGNMRLRALKEMGRTEAPVYVRDFETEAEKREWMLRDNSEYGEWVPEELAALLAAQRAADADLSLLGFTEVEVDALLKLHDDLEGPPREEPTGPLPAEPTTKPGQVWRLGPHLLACGSAIDAGVVRHLLDVGPLVPKVLATDPPFGIEMRMEWRDDAGLNSERVALEGAEVNVGGRPTSAAAESSYMREQGGSSDTRSDWSEAYALVPSLRVAYVWHADQHTLDVQRGMVDAGWDFIQHLVWDKEVLVLSRTIYHFRHELCDLYVKRLPGEPAPTFHGKQDQHTVWAMPSPKRMGQDSEEAEAHPAQKPVLLFETPARNHLARGECMYDPFVGSGTAIIACERADRVCYSVELNPGYCDLAIERWQNATGGKAELAPS